MPHEEGTVKRKKERKTDVKFKFNKEQQQKNSQ